MIPSLPDAVVISSRTWRIAVGCNAPDPGAYGWSRHWFGDAEERLSIAALLGHTMLTSSEARIVDRLSRMPGGARLVRTYLDL